MLNIKKSERQVLIKDVVASLKEEIDGALNYLSI